MRTDQVARGGELRRELCMSPCGFEVDGEDRQARKHAFYECRAPPAGRLIIRSMHTVQQFTCCNHGQQGRFLGARVHSLRDVDPASLVRDQDRRINQDSQRSSGGRCDSSVRARSRSASNDAASAGVR